MNPESQKGYTVRGLSWGGSSLQRTALERYSAAGTRIDIIRVIPYNKSQPDGWFKTLPTTYWGDGRQPNNAQLRKYAKLTKVAYVNLLCKLLKPKVYT